MGVTGLWRLIEPAGKPVPVETLENKVIAVDISIWLHQMVKGYQDTKGAPLPNAHLMGLFQRLCKLLYFRIKPVFVFDGVFPELKKETIAKRQHNKLKYNSESERLKRELALLLNKKTAISSLLGKDISPKKASTYESNNDDLFKLPALPERKEETDSESEDEESSSSSIIDLHSVDIDSEKFKSLPVKEKYDLLVELKETRKMNSWGKIHELPKKSDNFSDFQMQRLLKRRKVQECLEETEKEMGDGGMSITELESLLNEEGIDTKVESLPTRRIASNNTTRFLLINNVKQALADAKKKELNNKPGTSKEPEVICETKPVRDELEDDLEKAIKMSLECADADEDVNHDKSDYTSKTDDSWTSIMTDSDYTEGTDSEEGDGFEQSDMACAKAYIMQFSDFTNKTIKKIVTSKKSADSNKPVFPKVDEILEEMSKEKSIIIDKIDLSSDEEPKTKDIAKDNDNINDLTVETRDLIEENDISITQSSVIYVENTEQDTVLLDTSTEDSCETNFDLNCIRNNNTKITESDKMDEKDLNENEGSNQATQINIGSKVIAEIKIESDSSDDEFEEVPEIESIRTVVQLTLNMDEPCDKDDIFADIFMKKEELQNTRKPESIETNIEKCNNTIKVIENTCIQNKSESYESKSLSKEDTNVVVIDAEKEKLSKKQLSPISTESTANIGEKVKVDETENSNMKLNEIEACPNPQDVSEATVNNSDNTSKITNKETVQNAITVEELNKMAEKVANDEQELIQEKGRLDRIGRNITEQMTKEAQELLQIFGIPYIVAPMEAEAQCAFLESANLTDGTITDDSDIWLFGGKTVYKNFFNQKKHVLQFLSERIERSFNLTREQLVLLALLVGSDYTTGIDGIGPVTALEILASFPYNKKQLLNETTKQARYQQVVAGLQEFKQWVRAGKRTDNVNLKKKLRNVSVTDDFPSIRVVQAYMEPNVEKSEEKFTWGDLDITILRDYTKNKFGWSQNKLDEIINPVLKRLQERKSQKTVQDYFKRKVEFQSLEEQMSKRVKAAVQRMGPDNIISEEFPTESEVVIPSKKRKTSTKKVTKSANKSTVIPGTLRVSEEINAPDSNLVSSIINSKTSADIVIPKTQRFQEIIPQREKDKQCLLQNKMKAIELFRKTKIDRKKKLSKRKPLLPKDKAELSESSDGD